MDMIEALHGKLGDKASYLDYGYFGVLSAGFDENGRATGEYTPKISYRALQSIAALFNGIPEVINFPYFFTPRNSILIGRKQEPDFNALTAGAFKLPDGTEAFVYWLPTDLITSTVTSTVSISFATQKDKPRLLDPMTGKIYEIPDSLFVRHNVGCFELINIPLKDYPLFLLF